MKKIVLLLCSFLLMVTGCSITNLNEVDVDKNLDVIFSGKASSYNVNYDGYKYYVPKGLKFLNKQEYNAILQDKYSNKYYLYVDVVSYFHKIEIHYDVDGSLYYSAVLNYNDKTGYLQIDEFKDCYFVQFVYNYTKIEAKISKNNLVYALNNMAYILRSIKFNDDILESLIGENVLDYKEETFTLFDDDSSSQEDFLDVVSKYEGEEYKKAKDQEQIELDNQ